MSHLSIQDHGTLKILTPTSPEAIEWFNQHMPDDVQMWGASGFVVEPRYVEDIVAGMALDLDLYLCFRHPKP